jgi:hypothetical protein
MTVIDVKNTIYACIGRNQAWKVGERCGIALRRSIWQVSSVQKGGNVATQA